MTHRWYDIKAQGADTADLYVYGNIGDRWDENGVVAADLVREIAGLDVATINVRINSYGGSVTDGLAIYNALKRNKAKTQVYVDGVAISMASYIAMAGDSIVMAANAQMMIHAPWGVAIGNAAQLREQADLLDRYAQAMADAYAGRSGKKRADVMALLTDGKDHWFSADEAVAEGFATEIGADQPVAAHLARSFNLARFQGTPAAAPKAAASTHMPATASPAAAAAPTPENSPMTTQVPQAAAVQNTAPATPAIRTSEQNAQVLAMFKPFVAQPAVAALQTEVLAQTELTLDQIQARLLAELGKGAEPVNPQGAHPRVHTVEDETDKQREAMVAALRVRAGVETDVRVRASMAANPFRGLRLLDLARASLQRAGVKTDGMTQMQIVGAAFTQSTSDFPVLLENVMHKTLQAGYALAPLTWNRFCRTGSVSDFRAHPRYRTGSFGDLDTVTELNEFVNKTIPDGEKATISATTRGNVINLSRQAIINDDLGAFVGLANSLGQASARTVENAVYAVLAQNSGLGPTQADGQPLFHANRANVGTGAAITAAALDADASVMALQKDVSGNDYLDLRPSVLVVARALEGTARVINGSEYDPDANNKLQRPNVVRGLFTDIVGSPRLSGTRRYLFADPNVAPVLEVAFLDGATEPYMEMQDGFDVDGARWKVRLDFGVAAVDYRGAVTNAGA